MLSQETEVKVISEISELTDREKEELLFKAFDILLSAEQKPKDVKEDV